MDFHYVIAGFLVGSIVGVTGVGGGSLMTPLLILVFGVAPTTAVGTDLLYAGLTKGVGSIAQTLQGRVQWRIAGLLALGSLPAAGATTYVLARVGIDTSATSRLLTAALAVALLATAASLVFRKAITASVKHDPNAWHVRHAAGLTVVVGAALGVLVTLTSVGAGALGTIALILLYPRLRTAEVIGTDIAHAVPLTLIAGGAHAVLGTVDYKLLATLLAGSIPGILLGSYGGNLFSERHLRVALAVVLAAVGLKLIY
ncbi:MAG: sulfite exporter TauE/SafE family protein [Burkholderiales bacterium]